MKSWHPSCRKHGLQRTARNRWQGHREERRSVMGTRAVGDLEAAARWSQATYNLCRGKHISVSGDKTQRGLHSWGEPWLKSVNTDGWHLLGTPQWHACRWQSCLDQYSPAHPPWKQYQATRRATQNRFFSLHLKCLSCRAGWSTCLWFEPSGNWSRGTMSSRATWVT